MKRKTLKDIYLDYPYKCRHMDTSTVPLPYFPKEEIDCDHKYSMTYKEWKGALNCFFKHTLNALAQGYEFTMPYEMGRLQLRKVKGGGVDFTKSEKGNIKRHRNLHLRGWRFLTKWLRDHNRLQFKWTWRIRLTRKAWRHVNAIYENSPREINNLRNA